MARTLTAALEGKLDGPIIKPLFLVKIEFSITVYYSSRGAVAWDSQSWTAVGMAVNQIAQDSTGVSRGSISLLNGDSAISALILSEGARDHVATIWQSDGDALAAGDPVKIFEGVLDGAQLQADMCELFLRSDSDGLSTACRQAMAPPTFNHIPPSGIELKWGTEKISTGPIDPGATDTSTGRRIQVVLPTR